MAVKDFIAKEVNTIDYDATVMEAAKIMATDAQHQGYVLILKKKKPVGIITDRDIISKIMARAQDPSKAQVSEVMSSPLITIDPDEDLLKATQLMREHNVRKLVVIRNETIYGVITDRTVSQSFQDYVDKSVRDIIRWCFRFTKSIR